MTTARDGDRSRQEGRRSSRAKERTRGRTICGGFWPTGGAFTHVPELRVASHNTARGRGEARKKGEGTVEGRHTTTHPLLSDRVHIGDGVQPGACVSRGVFRGGVAVKGALAGSCQDSQKGCACRSQLVDAASLTDTMEGAMRVEDDVQRRGATHTRDAGRRSVRNMHCQRVNRPPFAYAVSASGAEGGERRV
jgi:hypothetical protein